MSEEEQKLLQKFARQNTLLDAISVVRKTSVLHNFYQHYTTLNRALDKIAGRWWLTRSDCDNLNDCQETLKYGQSRYSQRIFQTSFSYGCAEDVAMWGMYQRSNPLAIRISISKEVMRRWMDDICFNVECAADVRNKKIDNIVAEHNGRSIKSISFGDVIYVAVANKSISKGGESNELDIRRSNNLFWNGVSSEGAIDDLDEDIRAHWATALVKNYEWRHERESRLCVHLGKSIQEKAFAIKIPFYVVEDMRFTFSPWLPSGCEAVVKGVLETALKSANVDLSKRKIQRFRKSVLQGGLNFRDTRFESGDIAELVFRGVREGIC